MRRKAQALLFLLFLVPGVLLLRWFSNSQVLDQEVAQEVAQEQSVVPDKVVMCIDGGEDEDKEEKKIKDWFETDAEKEGRPAHIRSGWSYLNTEQFNEMGEIWLSKMDPPFRNGEFVFELGCGVGGILDYVNQKYGGTLEVGGSDFTRSAIVQVGQLFPQHKDRFFCQPMTERLPVANNTYDHVISGGALAMYLKKDQMLVAIKEAVRILKPGGSFGFSHFHSPGKGNKFTIRESIDPEFWKIALLNMGVEGLYTEEFPDTLLYQSGRYFLLGRKKY